MSALGNTGASVIASAPRTRGHRELCSALVRVLLAGASGFAWSLPLTGESGTSAALAGALIGALNGQWLGRSKIRGSFAAASFMAAVLFAWLLADAATSTRFLSESMGPGAALGMGSALRAGIFAFALAGMLRFAAARRPQLGAFELLVASVGIALLFAGHRDGVVARPLWFADWAGEQGFDPKLGLMFVGAALALVVCLAAALESERPWAIAAVLPLGALAFVFATFVDARDLPEAQAANDLGLTDPNIGAPPLPNDAEGEDGHNGGGAGQEGHRPPPDPLQEALRGQGRDPSSQGGGGGQQPRDAQGGPGRSGEQQQERRGEGSSQQAPDVRRDAASSGQSPAPMAVVILGDDYSPPSQAYYFRQQVWSEFNGGRLIESRRGDVDRDQIRAFPTRETEVVDAPPGEHHQLVRATVTMVVRHVSPFALESVVRMKPAINPKPGRFWRAYSFESMAPTWEPEDLIGRVAGESSWSQPQWDHYLTGPEDPRYGELARSLIEQLPEGKRNDPFMQALTVKLWMDQNLSYSTAERHAGVPDPTGDFLFGNRIGYCVHFAHAAVYMWRSLGIPARVSAGYHVQEDEVQGSTILIQGNAAHAWPELYLEGIGWVILDIAARENLDPPAPPMDAELARKMGDWARERAEPDAKDPTKPKESRHDYRREILLSALALLLSFFLATWSLKLWRRVLPHFCVPASIPRVAYRRALDRLSEAGHRRERGESREAFAARTSACFPAFSEMTALHLLDRFGDPTRPARSDPARSRPRWSRLDRALRTQVRAHSPFLRRLVGSINPLSFLAIR